MQIERYLAAIPRRSLGPPRVPVSGQRAGHPVNFAAARQMERAGGAPAADDGWQVALAGPYLSGRRRAHLPVNEKRLFFSIITVFISVIFLLLLSLA